MERILVHPSGWGFVEAGSGLPFVPWGCNYFDPFTGWAPQLWKQFDSARVSNQLAEVAASGSNTIRVFLTLTSLLDGAAAPSEEGLRKVEALLGLAERAGLRVIWSGPSLWEGAPAWWQGGRHHEMFIDPALVKDQAAIWSALAERMKGHPALLAYDLHNEPFAPYQPGPALSAHWHAWKTANAPAAPEEPPLPEPPLNLHWSSDLQRFRESMATAYVRQMVEAIRAKDDGHLVTIGLHQKSAPFDWYPPDPYAAFNPRLLAPYLDYFSVHFYPHHQFHPNLYRDPYETEAGMRETLIHARAVARALRAAEKPLIFEECGWYGGGAAIVAGREQPWRSEQEQTAWCRGLVEATQGDACGWLFWPYRDTPSSLDSSRYSGFYTAEGALKDWGRVFRELSPRMTGAVPARALATRNLPLDFNALVTDPQAVKAARQEYLRAFEAGEVVDFDYH